MLAPHDLDPTGLHQPLQHGEFSINPANAARVFNDAMITLVLIFNVAESLKVAMQAPDPQTFLSDGFTCLSRAEIATNG
jgi:hypothetical protein